MNSFLSGFVYGFVTLSMITICVMACQPNITGEDKSLTKAYFREIVFGNEWSPARQQLSKWEKPVYIYTTGDFSPALKTALAEIIIELEVLTSLRLEVVKDSTKANCLIFAGQAQKYWQTIEPNARHFLRKNKGFFFIMLAKDKTISRASILIDTSAALDLKVQKHLLREELTQALGLVNDSWKYPDSIFYQGWTKTQQYSPLDKAIIKQLYHPEIKSGMTWKEIQSFF